MSANALHVVFKVAGVEYALPADDVIQMESFNGATAVPGTRPYVAGVVQIRGKVVALIDLRTRFGLPPIERSLESRVLVARFQDRTVGLLVDSAREVVKLDLAALQPPPEMIAHEANGLLKAIAQVGPRMLLVLDFSKVIGEE